MLRPLERVALRPSTSNPNNPSSQTHTFGSRAPLVVTGALLVVTKSY